MVQYIQTSMNMDFAQLQREVGEWAKFNFPNAEPCEAVMGMGEESGEALHAALKMKQGIRGTKEEHLAALKDAIADICIYAAHACCLYGLSFQDAVEETWVKVSKRNWQSDPADGVA